MVPPITPPTEADRLAERPRAERTREFLLRLSDALRPLGNPVEIQAEAARMLGEHLQVDRSYYVEIDHARGLANVSGDYARDEMRSIAGSHPLAVFAAVLNPMRAGQPFTSEDVALETRISEADRSAYLARSIRSFATVPLIRDGELLATMSVTNAVVRSWTPEEIALLQQAGERTWDAVERGRAEMKLRRSDDRAGWQNLAFRATIDGAPLEESLGILARSAVRETSGEARTAFYLVDPDGKCLHPVPVPDGMPESYTSQVNGFPVGKDSIGCGLATATGNPVLTEDVFEDPGWAPWTHLAKTYDFRACWSFPITTSEGKPAGAFAMYFREPRDGASHDASLASAVTQAAAIILSHHAAGEERRRAERESARLQSLFDATLSSISDFAYAFDHDGRFVFVNQPLLDLWGLPLEDAVGKNFHDLRYPADLADRLQREILEVFTTKRGLTGETPYTSPTGQGGHYEYIFRPVFGREGTVTMVAGSTRDVTPHKHAEAMLLESERKLTEANRLLHEADRRKDEFLAMLGHELRNPLGVIKSAVHVMQARAIQDPVLERALSAAQRQSMHMTRLVDELLDVARITEGKVTLRQEIVRIAEVIDGAVETMRPMVEASRHQLSRTVTDESLCVVGDPVRLVQVIANLLSNAAKYTPPGGQIHVSAEHHAGAVTIRVRDTGQGIPAELLASVFDLFVQGARGEDRAQGGLGIGLTVAKRLVEMHGGEIRAASAGVGAGSEFTISLPVVGEFKPDPVPVDRASSALPAAKRILVVDDDEDAAALLAMILQTEGHEVVTASRGDTALKLAASWKPEVAILDIGMPDMDGYEVATRMKGDPSLRHVDLVALTGYGRAQDIERSRRCGFDHHLVKPFDADALRDVLK